MSRVEGLSAITLATHDMERAVAFYEKLGFSLSKGGRDADFSTFDGGTVAFNLIAARDEAEWSWWGRAIFHVEDVDAMYEKVVAAGIAPDFAPRDAPWGERYFHVTDPDGHEISFAVPLFE